MRGGIMDHLSFEETRQLLKACAERIIRNEAWLSGI